MQLEQLKILWNSRKDTVFMVKLGYLTKFDIKFLENAWGFHQGVT